jgi:hypothetical protein
VSFRHVLLVGLAAACLAADEPSPLPVTTLEQVWYHEPRGASLFQLFNTAGDLTITPAALLFSTGKRTIEVPLESIRVLSFGRLAGDVDTEWALLAVGQPGAPRIVGIRDGRKLGFGGRTREIFEHLEQALRQARAAQFAVPPGFRLFDDFKQQLTLAIPEGHDAHLASVVFVDGEARWGTSAFSSRPIRRTGPGTTEVDEQALSELRAGRASGFTLERRPIEPRMRCEGFSGKARAAVVALAGEDPLLGRIALGAPTTTPARIGGCEGLRVSARGPNSHGEETIVDTYAVARGETLFLFRQRVVAGRGDEAHQSFETALSTVTFSLGQERPRGGSRRTGT